MKVAFLFLIFSTLSFAANAQLCGRFGVTLNVHDSALVPLKNAKFRIIEPPGPRREGSEYLGPEHQFDAVSGRPGHYAITLSEGLQPVKGYQVVISAKGYADRQIPITFPHCQRIMYDITMLKTGETAGLVTGAVTDESGDPVTYAQIYFVGPDGERRVNSDHEGRYSIRLKPGRYRVESELLYFHTTRVARFSVPVDGAATLDIDMQSIGGSEKYRVIEQLTYELVGTVVDNEKQPVANSRVSITAADGSKTRVDTGADGKFTAVLPPGRYTVEALTGPFWTKILNYPLDADSALEVPLKMSKQCSACTAAPDKNSGYCSCEAKGRGEDPLVIDWKKKN